MRPPSGEPTFDHDAPTADVESDRESQSLQERFDRVLGGKFALVQPGNWPTTLPGVDSLSIIPSGTDDGRPPRSLFVIPFSRTPDGKERHATLTLTDTGILIGMRELPRHLQHLTSDAILREVLTITEPLGYGDFQWFATERELVPPGSWPQPAATGEGEASWRPSLPDPQRLEFLRRQQGVRFGFVNPRQGGFNGYHAFVFDQFCLLERPQTKHAAYFVDFEAPLDPNDLPHTSEELDPWIARQPWAAELQETKGAKRQRGVAYVEHRGEWERRLQEEIDRRTSEVPPRGTPADTEPPTP